MQVKRIARWMLVALLAAVHVGLASAAAAARHS